MKKNQSGFTVVEGLLIVLVIAIVAGTGWFVMQAKNKTNNTVKDDPVATITQNGPSENDITATPTEELVVDPSVDYTEYKNSSLGFAFSYPSQWGTLKAKTGTESLIELESSEFTFTKVDKVQLIVRADKAEGFKTFMGFGGPTFTPTASNNTYIWKYAFQAFGNAAGTPANEGFFTAVEGKNVTTYGMVAGDGCGSGAQWFFPVKSNFVGLNILYSRCYEDDWNNKLTQEEKTTYEKAYAQVKADIKKIPTTVQIN
jgi:hypothetical protein